MSGCFSGLEDYFTQKGENEMKPDIKWLDDPEVFRVMQLPAHSDHRIYANAEEIRQKSSSLYQSLDGVWDFCYSPNAAERPAD